MDRRVLAALLTLLIITTPLAVSEEDDAGYGAFELLDEIDTTTLEDDWACVFQVDE